MSKVVLITGAGQGLGFAIAQGFYDAGYSVVLTDVDENLVAEAAKSIDDSRSRAIGFKLDVLKKDDFQQSLDFVIDRFGRCDVLVNNAAMTPTTPVLDITSEEFDAVMSVNLRGTLFGCQVFAKYFSENGFGRIINMASLAGQMGGTASGAHYAASKAGIMTLTKVFARQFADHGVTVNAVAPGPVDVPSVRDKVPAEKLEHIINTMIPVKAMSSPGLIASMVVMLASEQSSTVTGACWDANGGIYMR
ncbi:SDR family NAD(P)-dependent oxidoreductase [Dasania marina]|uniref:SDR family NAD(P)-dependent oxidoreductase n=1 Tax=Dasania marina TaxID=471499 RepID=UPI0030DBDA6B|tara:strand:- start:70930 stop:71673 length:744 start_codon:yes stop_codon:yes gene_type:complete